MRVSVDREVCEAYAKCVGLCPEVFDLDEEDVLHIRLDPLPEASQEKVRQAVGHCPRQALTLEE